MQATENHFRAHCPIPARKFVGTLRKSEVHANAHDLRQRIARRQALQQILIVVAEFPARRRCPGNAGQCQRRGQHMFAEACYRIFGVKRVEQQRMTFLHRARLRIRQHWRFDHWPRYEFSTH